MSNRKVGYRQCRLKRTLKESTCHQTSYIPEPFCVEGKVLKLKNSNGEWENGWVVEQASSHRVEHDELPDAHQEIKSHRKATGDSQRKNEKVH